MWTLVNIGNYLEVHPLFLSMIAQCFTNEIGKYCHICKHYWLLRSPCILFIVTTSRESVNSRIGGLDLSRHGLNRDSRSRQFKNGHLDCRESLNALKSQVLTVLKSRFLSRSRSRLSISTVQKGTSQLSKVSTVWKMMSRYQLVSTVEIPKLS